MPFLTIFGVGLTLVTAQNASIGAPDTEEATMSWTAFKTQFNKTYHNADAEIRARSVFADNVATIVAHNMKHARGQVGYRMGVNAYSDLTFSEFSDKFLRKRRVGT